MKLDKNPGIMKLGRANFSVSFAGDAWRKYGKKLKNASTNDIMNKFPRMKRNEARKLMSMIKRNFAKEV